MTGRTLAPALLIGLLLTLIGWAPAGAVPSAPVNAPVNSEAAIIAAWRTDPVYLGSDPSVGLDSTALHTALAATSGRPGVGTVYFAMVSGIVDSQVLFNELFRAVGTRNTIILVDGLAVDVRSPALSTSVAKNGYFDLNTWLIAQYARPLLETRDVTGAVTAALQAVRGETPSAPPVPADVPADPATVAALTAALRTHPVYVDPAAPAFALSDNNFPDDQPVLLAVLPLLAPGAPEPRLADALAAAFPGRLVLVDRGGWLSYAGSGKPADLAAAGRYALGAAIGDLLYLNPAHAGESATAFATRWRELRNGTISRSQGVLTQAPSAASTAGYLAPWAFAGTALLLAIIGLGGWELRRAANSRRSAETLRRSRAAATEAVAKLAGAIVRADQDPLTRDRLGARLGQAAERLSTATALAEEASGTAEFTRAAETAHQGLTLLTATGTATAVPSGGPTGNEAAE